MSKFPKQQLSSLYQRLSDVAVDPLFEDKVRQQIHDVILNYEAKNLGLSIEMILLLNGEYASIEHLISHSKQPEGIRLAKQINKHPKLKLTITLVNQVFLGIDQQTNLPALLKHLIYQIRMPFLRLTLQQLEPSLNQNHPANLLIAELLSFIPFWKNEQKIGYPTFTKLSQVLAFEKTSDASVLNKLEAALDIVKQIKKEQIKRSLIFEKRIVETEDSLHRKEQAKDIVTRLISSLNRQYLTPDFVKKMFNETWSTLLNLEFVRNDDIAFSRAFKTMVSLLISCQTINSAEQLEWLDKELPKLSDELNQGFERLAIEDKVKNGFLNELEAFHINLMSTAKLDTTIGSSNTNKSQQQSDLIRLKPASFIDSADGVDNTIATRDVTDRKNIIAADQSSSETIASFIHKYHTQLLRNNENEKISLKEFSQLFSDPQISERYNNFDNHLKLIGKWFYFEDDNRPLKLIYIDPGKGLHLFVTQDSKKAHSLEYKAFEQQIKTGKISSVANAKLFQQAVEEAIDKLNNYLNQAQHKTTKEIIGNNNTKQDKKSISIKTSVDQVESFSEASNSHKASEVATEDYNSVNKKASDSQSTSPIDITQLAVGSWLKVVEKNAKVKCKLAAKIASKGIYVLVDRQGKKLFELTENVLIKRYAKGDIELIDFETNKQHILASVISQNRSLKSENMQ